MGLCRRVVRPGRFRLAIYRLAVYRRRRGRNYRRLRSVNDLRRGSNDLFDQIHNSGSQSQTIIAFLMMFAVMTCQDRKSVV